jgi:hypothetical protein
MSEKGCCGEYLGFELEEVTEEWRKLCNSELHTLHPLPSVIKMTKSGRYAK